MRQALILVAAALVSCGQEPGQDWTAGLIVDECAHTEFRRECDLTLGHEEYGGTPQELEACYLDARQSAMRFPAGVEPDCRIPGAAARLW